MCEERGCDAGGRENQNPTKHVGNNLQWFCVLGQKRIVICNGFAFSAMKIFRPTQIQILISRPIRTPTQSHSDTLELRLNHT